LTDLPSPTLSPNPLVELPEQKVEESGKELQCIKTMLMASMQGQNPSTANEFGRQILFST
jgi:chemotaxis protein MotA